MRSCKQWHAAGPGLLQRPDTGAVLVDFSSNDYLGLRTHPRLLERAIAWGQAEGSGSGASRLVTGTPPQTMALEQRLATLKGMEAARIFSSGWQANASVVPALARFSAQVMGARAVIVADKFIHASLYHGCAAAGVTPKRFRHNDMAHLDALLAQDAGAGLKIVLTESVFSMDGDRADMAQLRAITQRHNAFLCVDEAHATGILGTQGKGLANGQADLVVGTFSKALGGMGAFVAASDAVCRWLDNTASGFIYSTAPSAWCLGRWMPHWTFCPIWKRPAHMWRSLPVVSGSAWGRPGWRLAPPRPRLFPLWWGRSKRRSHWRRLLSRLVFWRLPFARQRCRRVAAACGLFFTLTIRRSRCTLWLPPLSELRRKMAFCRSMELWAHEPG